MRFKTPSVRKTLLLAVMVSALVLGLRPFVFRAHAALLPNRKISISTAQLSTTGTYKFSFDLVSATDLGSIRFEFCSNNPLIGAPCTVPNGLDLSGAVLSDQTGEIGFTIATGFPSNELVLSRTAVAPTPGPVSYTFDNIVNPNSNGSYYVRIETFQTEDASGSDTDYGGLAYSLNNAVKVSTTVPPYLLFCTGLTISGYDCGTATGDYINFGDFSTASAKTGTAQMVIATNARYGYDLTINGTTMLSGTNTIPALTSSDVSRPGTSQFGVNLRKNTDPSAGQNPAGPGAGNVTTNYNTPNRYRFVSGDKIVSSATVSDYRKFTVTYLVNIAKGQTPGIYVSTINYICSATF